MSKVITDTPRSRANISKVLESAQRGCHARTLSVESVFTAAKDAEVALARHGLPARWKPGAVYFLSPPRMPKSYKFASESTVLRLIRRSTGWSIDYVAREKTYSVAHGKERQRSLRLSVGALEYLLKKSIFWPLVCDREKAAYERGRLSGDKPLICDS